ISQQQYNSPELTFVGADQQQNLFLYRNNDVLPRAFFVDSTTVISDGVERLRFMNTAAFDPATLAILEAPLDQPISAPDSSSASVKFFSPNKVEFDVYTDKTALLVVSEVYYPKGWKATLETGEELQIHKTNHILRSVVIPAGNHTLTMTFEPSTYYTSITYSWIGWIVVYLGLAYFGFQYYQHRQKPEETTA
ncbi:MAG: YfhO family protein, partial [Calditrichaeota bacterium]|nr:YfhO family protein [Calditrichota bacterium]